MDMISSKRRPILLKGKRRREDGKGIGNFFRPAEK
jgi:hypothetical protein